MSDYVPDLLSGVTIDFSQQYATDGTTTVAGRAHPRDANGVGRLGVSPVPSRGMTDYGIRRNTYEYVLTVLHELIHFAGTNGRYTDRQLVEAINAMGGVPSEYRDWHNRLNPNSSAENSTFFDAVLQKNCPGPTN